MVLAVFMEYFWWGYNRLQWCALSDAKRKGPRVPPVGIYTPLCFDQRKATKQIRGFF